MIFSIIHGENNERGNIVKGKLIKLKIALSLVLIVALGAVFALALSPTKKECKSEAFALNQKVELGASEDKKEFSALFGGDVIFSAEKVLVNNEREEHGYPATIGTGATTFYAGQLKNLNDSEEPIEIFSGYQYQFSNIASETGDKTVIEDGQFVLLRNLSTSSSFYQKDNPNREEAVIVSLGAYVYHDKTPDDGIDNKVVETATEAGETKPVFAGITYLEATAYHNGEEIETPAIRNINVDGQGLFFDFVQLITQKEDDSNEGYYNFVFKYMIGGIEYSNNFSFYMVNESSYTRTTGEKTFGYTALPSLGWMDGSANYSKTSEVEGYVRFLIGKDGINNASNLNGNNDIQAFPTITYDYTKYKLSYTHNANQKMTTYDFDVEYASTVGGVNPEFLVCTIASNDGTRQQRLKLKDYDKESPINLATIMLTDPGTYVAKATYLYQGYNSQMAPEMSFKLQDIKLSVHGMEAFYSKANVEGAKMQYWTLSTTLNNHVDLFIPNGYDWNETQFNQNKKLGFAFVLKESEAEEKVREGDIFSSESQSASINFDGNIASYNIVAENVTKENAVQVDTLLNGIQYAETDQGSLWIEGNDIYAKNTTENPNNAFYYYSPKKITLDTLFDVEGAKVNGVYTEVAALGTKKEDVKFDFTNTTTFNKTGYYLVFIKVIPDGIVEAGNLESHTYYQTFAFRYTSDSVNIKLEKIVDENTREEMLGNKFTNLDVRISWATPGLFDRRINPFYYASLNAPLGKEELLNTAKHVLNTTQSVEDGQERTFAQLGSDDVLVEDGTFVKFLIKLESEGQTATFNTFTIDRTPITGVQPYLIQEGYMGTAVAYSYATKNNVYVPLTSGITDGFATLDWADKLSKAQITATYSYTPFKANSNEVQEIVSVDGTRWLTTNYELGETVVGAEIKKSNTKYNVSSDCILFNQGIYVVHLQDEAGNECYYAFVIDRSPNYFKVDGKYISNGMYLSANNVEYSVGNFKSFKLDVGKKEGESEIVSNAKDRLETFINLATKNRVDEFENYYSAFDTNAVAISSFFQRDSNNYNYFIVRNQFVSAFDTSGVPDHSISAINGTMDYRNILEGESCYKRILYVTSANHTDITKSAKAHSSVTIEINKDNALGKAYFSSDHIEPGDMPANSGENSANATVMDMGSDSNSQSAVGLKFSGATSARHLAFVWNKGTGIYEVDKVEFKLYNLNSSFGGNYYFYQATSSEPTVVYKVGETNHTADLGDGRLLFNFNGENQALDGLYVVTRYYRGADNESAPDYGDDLGIRNYYFIVDRNGIIDVSQNIGDHIKILLKENETEFNSFSSTGSDRGEVFQFKEDNTLLTGRYNLYLTTTKLPAVLQVPTGKYFDGTDTSAGYNAGRLRVSVYFRDVYQQFPSNDSTRTQIKLIYEGDFTSEAVYQKGYFDMDVYDYLKNNYGESSNLFSRLTVTQDGKKWLFLPGHYIIRITDRVISELGKTNEKFIGLNINGQSNEGPQTDVFTGSSESNMMTANKETLLEGSTNRHITASQEFLKITLPKYDTSETEHAQIDQDYLVIEQYINSVNTQTQTYHNLKSASNENIRYDEETGTVEVYLETLLRDRFGNIDLNNLNRDLKYVIKIRYDLNNNTDGKYVDKFANCYVYYTEKGERKTYFESAYTITIDREAPKNNVNYLNRIDALVNEYNTEFGTEKMFANGVHESTQLQFTYQYDKYYQTKDSSNLYVYHVEESTPFDKTDIEKIYIREFDFKSNSLSLPFFSSIYPTNVDASNLHSESTYAGLLGKNSGYYEIVEVDKAGNATQYLIYYNPIAATWTIPVELVSPEENPPKEINENTTELSFFKIESNKSSEFKNDYFFKIVLRKNNNVIKSWLTNVNTEFDKLGGEIVQAINLEAQTTTGSGGFDLEFVSRTTHADVDINMFNADRIANLDVRDLVTGSAGQYVINLAGANVYDEEQDLMFYAKEITIVGPVKFENDSVLNTSKFVAKRSGKIISYFLADENGNATETEVSTVSTDGKSTYVLYLTPVIGEIPDAYRFNASGQELDKVEFENDRGFTDGSNRHYSYSNVILKFDKTLYSDFYVEEKEQNTGIYQPSTKYSEDDSHEIYSILKFSEAMDKLLEFKVTLKISEEDPTIHHITIDKRMSTVALKDTKGATQDNAIIIRDNTSFDGNFTPTNIPNGVLVLNFSEFTNDHFEYAYILHEKIYNENNNLIFASREISGTFAEEIITEKSNPGIYRFEILVYAKNEEKTLLGNRVFAFEVKHGSSGIYEVRDENGKDISYFNNPTSERITITGNELTASLVGVGTIFELQESSKIDLYISTKNLSIALIGQTTSEKIQQDVNGNVLTVYKISRGTTYSLYCGILKVKESNNLISEAQLIAGADSYDVGNETAFTKAFESTDSGLVLVKGTVAEQTNPLLSKNKLQMEVQYLGKTVKTTSVNTASVLKDGIEILGSGKFSVVFKDVAGNVHIFANGKNKIDVTILKQVVVMLNDDAPVNNAVFNSSVNMTIFASAMYKAGSVSVTAYRNGLRYEYSGQNPNYVFSDFGNYQVIVSAIYKQGTKDIPLTKTLYFSILNVNEARTSIDLTSLSGYRLEKVTNAKGTDVTSNFVSMMNDSGMHVSYQKVMDNANKLGVTSGKVTFNLQYLMEDGIHPPRNVIFSFTLNSETPKIQCTLKSGESTKKKFEIFFNPAIIYEQIGEAGVFVNGELVSSIDENSVNDEVRITHSFKKDGDGDYYITLVSSSGVVLDSYKVTIKEPLNAWAIIVIIAVVGVVATIVVTIIVLRRRMRIR